MGLCESEWVKVWVSECVNKSIEWQNLKSLSEEERRTAVIIKTFFINFTKEDYFSRRRKPPGTMFLDQFDEQDVLNNMTCLVLFKSCVRCKEERRWLKKRFYKSSWFFRKEDYVFSTKKPSGYHVPRSISWARCTEQDDMLSIQK